MLELAACTAAESRAGRKAVLVAGVCGATRQAVREAELAARLGYHAALLNLGALAGMPESHLIAHARAVSAVLPLFGFYLQPAVGGRVLDEEFWRRFVEIENLVAIKVAPFDRYRTLDVVRTVAASGRAGEIALYTGNDDSIVMDLVTPFRLGGRGDVRFAGGLLGHWAFWTRGAVRLLARCRRLARARAPVPLALLRLAAQITDVNAAVFDAAHGFKGCIPGIHEVLRGQGLLAGTWCLDPREVLSPGQREAIARAKAAYPHLADDAFVRERLDDWLR